MAQQAFVRPARKGEGETFLEWSKLVPGFDWEIAYQPGTFTLASFNKSKIISYTPVQQPFVIETVAHNPAATDLEVAQGMGEVVKFLVAQCYIKGVAEIYFLASDKDTAEFAANKIFEELPYKVFRVKVSDLEPRPQES